MMETLPDTEIATCPQCKAEEKIQRGCCTTCGMPVYAASGNDYQTIEQQSNYLRLAVYTTAAITFVLGILEGFVDSNSSAMAINLLLSLVVLSLVSRVQENPVSVLSICILLNLASHTLFPFFDLFEMKRWVSLKLLLAIIPFTALLRRVAIKRIS